MFFKFFMLMVVVQFGCLAMPDHIVNVTININIEGLYGSCNISEVNVLLPTIATSTINTTTTNSPTITTTATFTRTTSETTTSTSTTTMAPPDNYACGQHAVSVGKLIPFTSPNYPENYDRGSKCLWEFTCNDLNGIISVSCDKFITETPRKRKCTKKTDVVDISDRKGKLGRFCGKDGPNLTTRDNYLQVSFKADGDERTKLGFSCSAICSVATNTTSETTNTPRECSKEITVSNGMEEYWKSPRYDGGMTDYPRGDYCCSLKITIPSTYSVFMVDMEMEDPSTIYESPECVYHNIEYTSSSGVSSKSCGSLTGKKWSEVAAFNTPLDFSFTWCSNKDDDTAIGFSMKITGLDLMPGH